MEQIQSFCLKAAAVQGFMAIACGAFGAHGLQSLYAGLPPDQAAMRLGWVSTGSRYQLIHAVALLALAALVPRLKLARARWAAQAFFYGPLIFSATLYAMALGAPLWLGAVTPLGGLFMLAAWALLFAAWDGSGTVAPAQGSDAQTGL
ncbi:MAG TPA: DUF423 domain-containing protein [bacterium]|jgi:uncharacterized membrane protein YgdD (TMEM256/DUF423 family)|nr:DUF423 domain-containing protein [bacterium]